MKACLTILVFGILCFSCTRDFEAPVPDLSWDRFESSSASSFGSSVGQRLEGVYMLSSGSEAFGSTAAAKWTYTANGNDTVFHLSFFCETEVSYFILEGKREDSDILLNGYWRKMQNLETGRARLTITKANGAAQLLDPGVVPISSIRITGVFGNGESVPDQPIELNYTRPLNHNRPLEIVAHRGGGSTADLLPASENSVEMIRLASRYGATGVEIDVRLTKDGVPILFHDATLSERLIQKNGLLGPISNFTYSQLTTLVRLINGERIPTLRQALDVVLYQTPLRFVWLDTKFEGSIQFLRDIQQEYIQKAVGAGRDLEIVIGLPDEEAVNQFLALPGYASVPSVCELAPEDVIRTNAAIWAPRWTLGLQKDETARMEALGKRVFVWTLDVPANVKQFLNEGNFDGILSNYPSIVAYYYYVTE